MDPAAAHAICDGADPVAAFCRDPLLWGPLAGDAALDGGDPRGARDACQAFVERMSGMSGGNDSHGRHALLTGAGGGIGLAVTEAFLAEGARCTAVDLRRHSRAPSWPRCSRSTPTGCPT